MLLCTSVQDYDEKPFQPWRCLCFGSLQITLTTPFRLMILHLLQIFFTDARTFMAFAPYGLDSTSGPFSVTATECSKWADSFLSLVTAVQ